MSTLERGMLRYMQGKTADAIARGDEPPWDDLYAPPDTYPYLQRKTAYAIAKGEEPPYGGLYAPGGLYVHQQTRVLLIHQLKELLGKIKLHRHITRMTEVCHFLRCCSLFCSAVIFELNPIVFVL
jgi:hypothetical protein